MVYALKKGSVPEKCSCGGERFFSRDEDPKIIKEAKKRLKESQRRCKPVSGPR